MLLLLSLIAVCSANKLDLTVRLPLEQAEKLDGEDLITYLRNQNLFQVKESKEADERMKYLMDSKYLVSPTADERVELDIGDEPIPEEFDAREKWPECAHLIGTIRDQTKCGSCWAVSAAETMTDRACIQSKGRIKVHLSDTDILSCCGSFCGYGCNGGYDIRAWAYIVRNGVCTGGPYGTTNVCKPYAFHPCGRHTNQTYYGECPSKSYETPKCTDKCQRGYFTPYKKDKIYAKNYYTIAANEEAIKKELMTNGPVQSSFDTYVDFRAYGGGVYEHTAGARSGGHAIKIIGWGVEKEGMKRPYWIIANSWNVDWGEKGFFRMIRGKNNCRLEELAKAGMMDV